MSGSPDDLPQDLVQAVECLTGARFYVEGFLERASPNSIAVRHMPAAIWLLSDLLDDEIEAVEKGGKGARPSRSAPRRRPGC